MSDTTGSPYADRRLFWAILLILAAYAAAAALGWPQRATAMIVEQSSAAHAEPDAHRTPEPAATKGHPPYAMVAPFALLLLAIAVLPLIPSTAHWWDSNLHRFYVAAALAAVILVYYLFFHGQPVDLHWPAHRVVDPNPAGPDLGLVGAVAANALLNEYLPFIVLLLTLYTISGGIRIEGDLEARPLTNTTFLVVTGLLASLIGTTGAAMLLIRPLLETNRQRKHVAHTVVFFIFVACNCGGCLLPLGDPPLFLGYLMGIPFLWTLRLWPEWLFVNGSLIVLYFAWDWMVYRYRETARDRSQDVQHRRRLEFSGLWPNAVLLGGVILTVGLLDPAKPLPGSDWHPWLYLREAIQLGLIAASLGLGSSAVRRANHFNYGAILEVAALFFGIFLCMQAPLQILHVRGPSLGLDSPLEFFFATGALSSVLDNAPTYVVFFETARSLGGATGGLPLRQDLLVGISLGAVFGGAMTYIGNGPNFMVKSIAEKSGIAMPSFFGYMLYSVGILLPLLALASWLFL